MASIVVRVLALLSFRGQLTLGEQNVYDEPMSDCGSSHSNGCTYVAADAGAHEVCVTELPKGFSSATGQGPWSDEYTGQPWCICIWAYSNYILKKKDLSLRCESIPSKVLEEQYSLDKFKECGNDCGAEDIRRSIQSLCEQCATQAKSVKAGNALNDKCDAILAAAPAASMQRLYSEGVSKGTLKSEAGIPPFVLPILVVFIVGGACGMIIYAVRKGRRVVNQNAHTNGAESDAEGHDSLIE